MSSQKPPWQICSGPRRPESRCSAGIPCNAHVKRCVRGEYCLLTGAFAWVFLLSVWLIAYQQQASSGPLHASRWT